ncbi:MAG: GNAT family N-acetyltransferase, partial [Candidatus Diapherotrites archaeon]|nr:GNAT family N-acetyltransferase [Candidatus Diapherotrites archaeon]
STALTKLNMDEVEKAIRKWKNYPSVYGIFDLQPAGRGLYNYDILKLNAEERKNFKKQIEAVATRYDAKVVYEESYGEKCKNVKERALFAGCRACKTKIHILPNGWVTPCVFLRDKCFWIVKWTYGKRITEIWKAITAKRKNLKKHPDSTCLKCGFFINCMGGCTANSYNLCGKLELPDPTCPNREINIKTRRLNIRQAFLYDAKAYTKIFAKNNIRFMRANYLGEKQWRKKLSAVYCNDNQKIFTILNLRKQPIGSINVKFLDKTQRTGEIGIIISKSEQNKGYGREALRAILQYLFSNTPLKELYYKTICENRASVHLIRKIKGATFLGTGIETIKGKKRKIEIYKICKK